VRQILSLTFINFVDSSKFVTIARTLLFYSDCVVVVERIKDTRAPFYRPPLPQQESEGVHPDILTLMKQCWDEEPSERPSFNDISRALKFVNKGK